MTDTIEIEEREAFVIYSPTRGYVKNKKRDFTPEFASARLYGRRADAEDSVHKGQLTQAVIIPVSISLDPRHMFAAVLRGS